MRKILVGYRIIEYHKSFRALNHLILNVLPGQFRAQFFSSQIAIQGIVTELLTVLGRNASR
jgi:hypothetical protein